MGDEQATDGPGGGIQRRDEILQVMYWLQGEGLAREPSTDDIRRFLDRASPMALADDLETLAAAGLVEPVGGERYRLTLEGRNEGARRFADVFQDLSGPGHGVCDDPTCDCHLEGPEACTAPH